MTSHFIFKLLWFKDDYGVRVLCDTQSYQIPHATKEAFMQLIR